MNLTGVGFFQQLHSTSGVVHPVGPRMEPRARLADRPAHGHEALKCRGVESGSIPEGPEYSQLGLEFRE